MASFMERVSRLCCGGTDGGRQEEMEIPDLHGRDNPVLSHDEVAVDVSDNQVQPVPPSPTPPAPQPVMSNVREVRVKPMTKPPYRPPTPTTAGDQ